MLYLQYLEKQVDPALLKQITAKANAVEKAFNVYRAKVDGKEMTDSEVRKVLKESKNSDRRQAVWEASKGVGAVVAGGPEATREAPQRGGRQARLQELPRPATLSQRAGRRRAFSSCSTTWIELTREPFRAAKAEIDEKLAGQLRHQPGGPDAVALPRSVFSGVAGRIRGRPRRTVQERRHPEACAGDSTPASACRSTTCSAAAISTRSRARARTPSAPTSTARATCACWPTSCPTSTGCRHDAARAGPLGLQQQEHSADAALCLAGRGPHPHHRRRGHDVRAVFQESRLVGENGAEGSRIPRRSTRPAAKVQRNELLIFSRWCQVMLRFEKAMYENPDQDLNRLWWDLVEKYQMVKRPAGRNAPDYGSKIHIVSAPVYYHNYMMGAVVRVAVAPCHRPGRAAWRRSAHRSLQRSAGGWEVPRRKSVRAG